MPVRVKAAGWHFLSRNDPPEILRGEIRMEIDSLPEVSFPVSSYIYLLPPAIRANSRSEPVRQAYRLPDVRSNAEDESLGAAAVLQGSPDGHPILSGRIGALYEIVPFCRCRKRVLKKTSVNLLELLVQGTNLSVTAFLILCGVSFLGSLIAGALGLGGGVLVLATMANLLPPTVLVPLHGVVQLGSNLSRAIMNWRRTLMSIVAPFLVGSIIGAALGAQFIVALPKYLLQIVIAVFILASTWAPKFQSASTGKGKFFFVGVITTIVTMFVGGTGVLVGAFVAPACPERHQFVSTHAVVMTIQHSLKIVTFTLLGFAFGPYIPLLVGLVLFSFIGSYAGKLALNRLPERIFRIALKTTLTILSLQLLYTALSQILNQGAGN